MAMTVRLLFSAAATIGLLAGCGGGGTAEEATTADAPRASVLSAGSSPPIIAVSASTALGAGTDAALAHMMVLINGTNCGEFDVETVQKTYEVYVSTACPSITSPSTVQVRYTNDSDNRDLVVYSVTINGSLVMAPTLADYLLQTGGPSRPGSQKMFWSGELRFPYIEANAYFVDSKGGTDQGNGSLGSPFKSIQRAISAINVAPKSLYLRCGGLWREDIKNAAFPKDAEIASYGTSPLSGYCTDKPVISGSDVVANVSTDSNGRLALTIANAATKVARVTVDQLPVPLVEWPAQPSSAPSNYAKAIAGSSNTLVMGAGAPTVDLKGATINIRTRAYAVATATVASQQGATLTLDRSLNAGEGVVASDAGYVLQNASGLLTNGVPGFYAKGSSLQIATQTPSRVVSVEYSQRDSPIYLGQVGGLRIRNIKVTGGQKYGIVLSESPGVLLDHVESSGNAGGGVSIYNSSGATIQDSVFDDNWIVGIDTSTTSSALIKGNVVTRTGTSTPLSSKGAIRAGPRASVIQNSIDGATSSGILINPVVAATIDRNFVKNYCTRFSDCGAIYSANEARLPAPPATDRVVISNNVVGPGAANLDGAIGSGITIVAGVYMDDFTTQIDIKDNTLFGMPIGVNLHNSSKVNVTGNKIWLTTDSAVSAGMDIKDGVDYLMDDVVDGNEIAPFNSVAPGTTALPQFVLSKTYTYLNSKTGTGGLASVFKNNRILALNGVDVGRFADVGSVDANLTMTVQTVSASEWSSYGSTDVLSVAPVWRPLYIAQDLSANPTFADGFDNVGSAAWVYNGSGGSANYSVQECDAGRCLAIVVNNKNDTVENPWGGEFPLTANGDVYLTSFTARVSPQQSPPVRPAILANPYIRQRGYGSSLIDGIVTDRVMSGAPGAVIHYQALFQAKAVPNAVYGLQLKSVGIPVTVDSVVIKKVSVNRKPVQEWAAVVSAPWGALATLVDCSIFAGSSGTSCDVRDSNDEPVPMPASIPAGTARLLLKR